MALPKRYARLVGSKFTSTASFLGWRHFHVGALRRNGAGWDAEVVSSVEPATRAWVDVGSLLDRCQWDAGWKLLKELAEDLDRPACSRGPDTR